MCIGVLMRGETVAEDGAEAGSVRLYAPDGEFRGAEALAGDVPANPRTLSRWLRGLGVRILLTRRISAAWHAHFGAEGVFVIPSMAETDPERAVRAYVEGHLETCLLSRR